MRGERCLPRARKCIEEGREGKVSPQGACAFARARLVAEALDRSCWISTSLFFDNTSASDRDCAGILVVPIYILITSNALCGVGQLAHHA